MDARIKRTIVGVRTRAGLALADLQLLTLACGLATPFAAPLVNQASAQQARPDGPGWPATRDIWRERTRDNSRDPAGGERRDRRYRTYDGTDNNTTNPRWGSAGVTYLREESGAHYADRVSSPAGANRPSARIISNTIAAQGDIETVEERGIATCWYEFGQFLDHDIGLAKGASSESFDIPVPRGDPFFDPAGTGTQVIWMDRSAFAPPRRANAPRQQINSITAFIDGSQIYGSDADRAAWLRSGIDGRLKSRSTPQGEMLPLNDGSLANDNPVGAPATSLVVAGDVRANEQPGLTTLHTVFLREHNYQAGLIKAAHPRWNDERIFQEARRIVIAELQVIVTKEFLPSILGRELPCYSGYRPGVNPGISNLFATAGYRIGHSVVGPDIEILDRNFVEVDSLPLADIFFNPAAIPSVGGIDPFVRYFATATMQKNDTQIVDALRNFLFGPPGAGGFDLASLNIQRGRDHGLADYNTARRDFGLRRVTSFAQVTSNADLAGSLESLYGSVNNIDPWVGMLAEDHVPGTSVGPTHRAVIIDQFVRLRDGDRFWYENRQFSPAEVAALEATRLSDILGRNSGEGRLQSNVFFATDLAATACPADFNCDGAVTVADFEAFQAAWDARDISADFDYSGTVDETDLADFVAAFTSGC